MKNRKKSLLTLLAAGAFALSAASTAAATEAVVGQPAPTFSLPDTTGQSVALADEKGKFVVLEWTNESCPFVKKHYGSGNMQKLQETYTGKGVVWLSIASSAPGKEGNHSAAEWSQIQKDRNAHPSALLLDPAGTVGKSYGAKTTPHMFVIDPSGTLIYEGAIDDHSSPFPGSVADAKNYVATALDQAMAGQPVTTATTKPYGCSVKYSD